MGDTVSVSENRIRLVVALLAALIVALGYLVAQPFPLATGVVWLCVSLAPPAIYYLGTRGPGASIVFGALLLGITVLGWGSVFATNSDDGLVGVYPFAVFALTTVTSLIGAAVGAATERWQQARR